MVAMESCLIASIKRFEKELLGKSEQIGVFGIDAKNLKRWPLL